MHSTLRAELRRGRLRAIVSPMVLRLVRLVVLVLPALSGVCPMPCQVAVPPPPDPLLEAQPYTSRVHADDRFVVLENGLIRLRLQLDPFALVSFEQLASGQQLLRAASSLGELVVDGRTVLAGGMVGQPNRAFLLPEWLDEMKADPRALPVAATFSIEAPDARMDWRRTRHAAPDAVWPPAGRRVRFVLDGRDEHGMLVVVHLQLYDALPLFSHQLEYVNVHDRAVELDSFVSLRLPIVEAESRVEPQRRGVRLPNLYVETDFSFHAMTGADGSAHCVRWREDPEFGTQVNYRKQTLCTLEVGPEVGPKLRIGPGQTFRTFRTFVLAPDRDCVERRTLWQRRMYRTIAPWSTENPLMMHVRSAEPDKVRLAIDQCREVGFEMVILTFGSGFDIEDDSEANLERYRELADYAHERGVQLGGYSLLSSRRIQPDSDNCIDRQTGKPGGQVFGHAPALASEWGQRYFRKLYRFFEHTGFDLLEHDGSYPGDFDASARPPLQRGYEDSRWVQYGIISEFYRWCRARGVYLNVPDWYFLQGSSKTGMGYRETNWSLPRRQQVIHTRQNLFDGTRDKTPSMGWMFVPLTEYHGGGAAATIEPLRDHLDHYRRMFESNLGYGAQACWRGPRLFDCDEVRDMVRAQVARFVEFRTILESDVIHSSSRRADGQDLDWVLHCNPNAEPPAMLCVFNPTTEARERIVRLDLYYAGLRDVAQAVEVHAGPRPDATEPDATAPDATAPAAAAPAAAAPEQLPLDPRGVTQLSVRVAPGASRWFAIR